MFLSKRDIKELSTEIEEEFGVKDLLSKKDQIEKKGDIIYKDNLPIFFYKELEYEKDNDNNAKKEKLLVPHLKLLQTNNFLKKIVVDMLAVPYMIKGADVMRPGIKEIDGGIAKGEIVAIVDEMNKKAIAVGIAEFSTEEMREMMKGRVIKNIHWVGDEIWNVK